MLILRASAAAALLAAALLVTDAASAQGPASRGEPKDPMQEGLPLKPSRTVTFTTRTGHWMSVDVSPDGQTLVLDLLGDLYLLPIAGGKATPLTRGMAFDAQPRFSPDGKRIVFVSDRDGGYNLYQMSLDKRDTVQMTRGKTNTYESPDWTPDGRYVVVTRNMKLHLYHADGGTGQQLIREPANRRTLGAALSPDGRYIWFAQRTGQWQYNTPLGDYSLATYDRQTGQTAVRATRWGSAFRPTLSPDGQWLVYGTRHIDTTRLRIRDLRTGDERWLVMRTQRDDQESRATLDAYPGMSFTPDSRFVITTWDGKLWKVPVDGGAPQEIPFEAEVVQALGPYVEFNYPIPDSAMFTVKQIRDAAPSPDGARLAFTAMDRLYVMDWPNGTPRRVTTLDVGEFHPAWSPDGRSIAFTTMSATDGGHLYRIALAPNARPQRLTTASAFWQRPAWSPDGARIVAIRGPIREYAEALAGGVGGGAEDLVWLPAAGGDATVIAPAGGLDNPHFARDPARLYAYSSQRGLVSMRLDGTDTKTHLRVNRSTPAPPGGGGGPPGGPAASLVTISPTGDAEALAQVSGDVYLVTVPQVGGTEPTITVGGTDTSFPVRRLTDIGGQFPTWSRDGRRIHWSIGNAHVSYDLAAGRAFDDSVRQSRRGAPSDTARGAARPPVPQFKPLEKRILISARRDIPQQTLALRGARIVTMKGNEVIENGDILIRNNRIAAVGAAGSVPIPAGARSIDVAGATIVPGFVDTHAHVRATFDVHRQEVWSYSVNLAYGVTTIRDPQTASTDVLSYEDMVLAGQIVGPRIYSTGPGVFGGNNAQGNNLTSLDQARTILKRYSQYYDTKTIKQYQIGNREQRQWVIMAANELGLMPTTEGGLDYKMNVTEATDGYSGHEHTIPTFPLQSDFIRFYAESRTVYTPTILVAYGGPWAENYWYETENVLGDEKLKHFTPWADLERKILRRGGGGGGQAGWFHESQYVMQHVGESIRDLIAAGGRAGVGSHGQLQGLGYHWELWSMAKGGLSNHDALRVATQMGADAIGLGKEVGSIESGKLADLVILNGNPLESLRNTNTVRLVVKNGRVYDGNTLKER